jgi:transcriptional regulator
MYVPAQFAEDRLPVLHDAIRAAGLANLVTAGPDGIVASPLPLIVDPADGPYGTLHGHLSRANPQWRSADPAIEALAIFMGADAYITPSSYQTKRETGKVVPTWNYITIHAYGTPRFSEDPAELLDAVTRLTGRHEAQRAQPWAVTDAPADFVQAHLKGIIAFRMPITRLQGKWKMSQNRNAADREGVVTGLREDGQDEVASIVAGRMD